MAEHEVKIEVEEEKLVVNGFPIYASGIYAKTLLDEHQEISEKSAITQFAKMACLPGLIGAVGLPDIHGGYAFPIGSVAAVDLTQPDAAVSPEGVGYDINCGVCLLRTTLCAEDIKGREEELAEELFKAIPSGVGGINPMINLECMKGVLDSGLPYLEKKGMIPEGTCRRVESGGSLEGNSRRLSQKARAIGVNQLGSLGSGNHYLEIQVVSDLYDDEAAVAFGMKIGQVLVSIHTGSRGLGHTVCTEFMKKTGKAAHVPFHSPEGKEYMELMNSAANFAWANRAMVAERTKGVLARMFPGVECDLVYDAAHNIAKIERIGSESRSVLVHRKGASRAVPPGHPDLPKEYAHVGQPVPVGGSMGTCSFVLAGDTGSELAWYSTCHGAGRVLPRNKAKKTLKYEDIAEEMAKKGIAFRCGSETGMVEEAPCCYKDIEFVVEISRKAGLTKTVARAVPVVVIKG